MTQIIPEDVLIDGATDTTQLRVQGSTAQTNALQTWEIRGGDVVAQVTGDGRIVVGDDAGAAAPNALLEVHRAETSRAPRRGVHALGRIAGVIGELVAWSVHELELIGSDVVGGVQTALRVRATHDNDAFSPGAELCGVDAEVVQKQGNVGRLSAIRAAVSKFGGSLAAAYGVKVEDVEGATENFALHTGKGVVRFGDSVRLGAPNVPPGTPPANEMHVYPKADGKLYAKNSSGTEYDLTGGGLETDPSTGDLKPADFPALTGDVTTAGSSLATTIAGGAVSRAKMAPDPNNAGKAIGYDPTTGAVTALSIASAGVPTGSLLPYAGSSAPAGWLFCDGSAVSRSAYAALFAVIGTTYGAGDGSTTFTLPDVRGRTVIGAGQGTGLTNRTLAQSVGAETHVLTVAQIPAHSHVVRDSNLSDLYQAGSQAGPAPRTFGFDGMTYFNNKVTTGNTGSGQAHNNMQPSLALNYIIKT